MMIFVVQQFFSFVFSHFTKRSLMLFVLVGGCFLPQKSWALSIDTSFQVVDRFLSKEAAKVLKKNKSSTGSAKKLKAKKTKSIIEKSWGMLTSPGVGAFRAWTAMKSKVFQKSKCRDSKMVVAVIDTGVDFTHPDLKESKWVNQKELNGKAGIDDDGNGFIDDVHGWDFSTKSAKIVDEHGHGTHIAGIIAANAKSAKGMLGVCPGVKIMSIRYYNAKANGQQNLLNTVEAFKYAVNNGATIINYSGGGSEFSRAEFEALKSAHMKDILVVAAAGNERSNADQRAYYPAAYNLPNIVSVTAIDQSGKLLSASNWGVKNVDIAAPGYSILSTQQNGKYGYMQGTSQATAFVTGIASLLMTEKPGMSALKVKQIIEDTAVRSVKLFKKARTSSQVSALKAIESLYKKPEIASSKLRRLGKDNSLKKNLQERKILSSGKSR